MLRRLEGIARGRLLARPRGMPLGVRAVLACLVLFLAAPAPAGSEQTKAGPQALWQEFPVNPSGERLGAVQKPSALQNSHLRAQGIAETYDSGAGTNTVFLAACAGALALLALVGLLAIRMQHARSGRRRSVPLWQGAAGLARSHVASLQSYRDIDAPVRQRAKSMHWGPGRAPPAMLRASRASPTTGDLGRDLRRMARRARRVLRSEDTAAVLVGVALAIMAAFVVVYFAG